MCGILAYFGVDKNQIITESFRSKFLELSKLLRHRGPDWNGIYTNNKNVIIAHERLSIIGVDNGSQPIIYDGIVLSINGEIYNYKDLYKTVLHGKYDPTTKSDCEVIIYLYLEFGAECVKMLDGVFSFVLYDSKKDKYLIARDPIGVTPLYIGYTKTRDVMVASELKSITTETDELDVFPPGHYLYDSVYNSTSSIIRYYNPRWLNHKYQIDGTEEQLCKRINECLTDAVHKRLMADVPYGVLVSGGLDSSAIAAIANRYIKSHPTQWGDRLHTFSIGLEGSPDLLAARKVATFLDTIHHEFHFTIQEGLDAVKDVIEKLETYDITTIRASTPMYLLSRKIKAMGIKMVLSGEGADEIFGGYLYFHKAPNGEEFHKECIQKVCDLHTFDCLRANKSTMSWGLEVRVPFLDKRVLENTIPIVSDKKLREYNGKKIEKYILRKAFDTPDNPYLPDEILWRQKEQFSDGVGYSWIDYLIEYTKKSISDEELKNSDITYNKPKTKEGYYYRKIFDSRYPKREKVVPLWIPKTDWDGVAEDPSGRSQTVHNDHTEL